MKVGLKFITAKRSVYCILLVFALTYLPHYQKEEIEVVYSSAVTAPLHRVHELVWTDNVNTLI